MQGSSFFNVPSKLLGKSPANIEHHLEKLGFTYKLRKKGGVQIV